MPPTSKQISEQFAALATDLHAARERNELALGKLYTLGAMLVQSDTAATEAVAPTEPIAPTIDPGPPTAPGEFAWFDWTGLPTEAPPVEEPAAPTIIVEVGKLTYVASGSTVLVQENALAEALRTAKFGDVIEIRGKVPGVAIGGPYSPNSMATLAPVGFITIQGGTPDAEIAGGIKFVGRGLAGLGWENITVRDLTITAALHDIAPAMVVEDAHGGLIRFLRCKFQPHPNAKALGLYEGWGCRFGIRAEGQCRIEVIESDFSCGFQEHPVYLDNLQGASIIARNVWGPSTRTRVQVTTRRKAPWNPDVTHAPSFGHLLICDHDTEATHWGSGGAAYTVAGHLGPVTLARLRDDPRGDDCHGGIAIWQDLSPEKGAPYLDADGYAVGPVRLIDCWIGHEHSDRACAVVSACRELTIEGAETFLVASDGRADLHIDHQGAAVKPVGRVRVGDTGEGETAIEHVKVGDDRGNPPFLNHEQRAALFAGKSTAEVLGMVAK